MSARAPRERLIGVIVSLVLLLLIGWAATHRSGSVTDRRAETLDALRSAGIEQARVEVSGAEVTVYGLARDRHERERALRDVGDVSGVRIVTDRLTIGDDLSEPTLTGEVAPTGPDTPTLRSATPGEEVAARSPATVATASSAATPTSRTPRRAQPSRAPSAGSSAPPSDDLCAGVPAQLRGLEVAFAHASATLTSDGVPVLASLARHLDACPDALLEIRAYADQAAGASANLVLSRQRAQVVAGHLGKYGVAPHRLVATYRGDKAPAGNRALLTLHQDAPQ